MDNEFFMAVEALAADKEIPVDYLYGKIEVALAAAMRKNYGGNKDRDREIVSCVIDPEKHTMDIWANLEVAETAEDDTQISLEDALKYDETAAIGAIIKKPIALSEFGRIAAQTAKHVIRQGIREAERNQQIEEFRSKQGEIVNAKVVRIDSVKGNVSLEIGKGEALLPKKEQVPGEHFREGQIIKVYIVDIRDGEKGAKVMISRTHPGFVRRLFEQEVPEIKDGLVEIKSVSREAGSRTKIAVYSSDPDVDPIGSCIGPKGSRVNTIVDILGGEKIDIIKYSDDPVEYISAALAPADVITVEIAADGAKTCKVAVPDDQLSLAIGNKGQNARLAVKLTGWNKIDIKSETAFYDEKLAAEEAALEAEPAETSPEEAEPEE